MISCWQKCKVHGVHKAIFRITSYLQQITYFWIMIYCSPNIRDEFHNPLGLHISSKCFSSKYTNSWNKLCFPLCCSHFFHLFIAINNSQDVQQLTLVFMDTLHLKIKQLNLQSIKVYKETYFEWGRKAKPRSGEETKNCQCTIYITSWLQIWQFSMFSYRTLFINKTKASKNI